jgi:hypothetical protein
MQLSWATPSSGSTSTKLTTEGITAATIHRIPNAAELAAKNLSEG